MRSLYIGLAGMAAIGVLTTACASSSNSSAGTPGSGSSTSAQAASGSSELKTMSISGATVLTNSGGFVLYWFVSDTPTKSNCNGSCATYWPPVKGPVTAGSGVTGTLGTITRSDGTTQATWDGHPLYTYAADSSPGKATGNGLNASGGVWHEVTLSGTASKSGSSSSGGGYGY